MKTSIISFISLFFINLLFAQSQDTTIIFQEDTIDVTAEKYFMMPNINSIGAKISLPIHKTPASIGVVTSNIMKEQNATVLSDALKNISGINVQSNLGTSDFFLIRGFESNSAGLVLTDGVQSPDISMYDIYGFGFHDMYNIEQVEVLKGPASFLYGANTLSGAVSLVRKKPIPRNFVNLSIQAGNYKQKRGSFDTGVFSKDKSILYRFNGLMQYSEQYRKGKFRKTSALNPSLKWNINKDETLNINFEYVNNFLIPDAGIPLYIFDEKWRLPEIPLDMTFQTPLDKSNQEKYSIHIDYEKKIGKSIEVNSKLYFRKITSNTDLTIPNNPQTDFSGTWIVKRHIYSFGEEQEVYGNQNEAKFISEKFGIKNQLLVGFESALLKYSTDRAISIIPSTLLFYHKEKVKNSNDVLRLNTIDSDSKYIMLAPYFVNYLSLSEHFQVLFGGRYDIFKINTNRQDAPFDYFTMVLSSAPEPLSKIHKKFSPMLGLIVEESANLWFYMNIGKSFSRGRRIIDSPITSTQFEIGYKYRSQDGKVRNSFAIYSLQKENIAIPLQGPLQGFAHSPSGNQRSQGLEFEVTAQLKKKWHLFFTYAYTNSELLKYNALYIDEYFKIKLDDFSNNSPAFNPAHLLNIWSTTELYRGLGIGGGINYVGKQYAYIDNQFEIKGYFLYDLSMFYLSDQWECRINLKNITSKKYLTRGFGPYSVTPVSSMYVTGGISFNF